MNDMNYWISHNENERLKELYLYDILDTAPEQEFNELTEIASQITGCPIAAINFIDKNRQWSKARKGDETLETAREISFCAQTILADEPLVVQDASKDVRFLGNPDVTSESGIRFYAGVPIYSLNHKRIGAVCVADKKPKNITETEIAALKLISRQVSNLLELRLKNKLLREYTNKVLRNSETAFEAFFDQSVDPKWIYEVGTLKFLQVNEAAIKKYGYSRTEFSQMSVFDIRTSEARKNIHNLVQIVKNNDQPSTFKSTHQAKDGRIIEVEVSIVDFVFMGKPARLATMRDVSEKERLKSALKSEKLLAESKIELAELNAINETKEEIGKELHDNINQILATIKLFLDIASNHEEMRMEMIDRCKVNITEAISAVRQLSKSLVSAGDGDFNLTQSLDELVWSLSTGKTLEFHLTINDKAEELPNDLKLNLFRIIQEQMNNILKHAHASEVWISLEVSESLLLQIRDNGLGFEAGKKGSGIGLENMKKRARFYNGSFEIISNHSKGTTITVDIPLQDVSLSN